MQSTTYESRKYLSVGYFFGRNSWCTTGTPTPPSWPPTTRLWLSACVGPSFSCLVSFLFGRLPHPKASNYFSCRRHCA